MWVDCHDVDMCVWHAQIPGLNFWFEKLLKPKTIDIHWISRLSWCRYHMCDMPRYQGWISENRKRSTSHAYINVSRWQCQIPGLKTENHRHVMTCNDTCPDDRYQGWKFNCCWWWIVTSHWDLNLSRYCVQYRITETYESWHVIPLGFESESILHSTLCTDTRTDMPRLWYNNNHMTGFRFWICVNDNVTCHDIPMGFESRIDPLIEIVQIPGLKTGNDCNDVVISRGRCQLGLNLEWYRSA